MNHLVMHIRLRRLVPLISAAAILFCTQPTESQLHFASLGNWGSGGSTQYSVGSLLKSRAKENSLSLLISPGSNFIDGVKDLNDSRWDSAFEKPYEGPEMHLPFFTVLGAQDWEGAEDIDRMIPKWTLPNFWYHYSLHFPDATEATAAYGSADASVGFVFIDTFILSENFAFHNITKLHWDAVRATLGASVKIFDWVIVVGDKAILSSGASKGDKYLSDTLRQLMKDHRVDAYISGNDYNMEIIEDGPLLHINCGTGSGADPLMRVKADNSIVYVAKPGFCHHVLTKKKFHTEFIDGFSGKAIGNYTKSRNVRDRSLLDRFHLYQELPEVHYTDIPQLRDRAAGENDLFVRICGTIGLITSTFVVVLFAVVMGNRIAKAIQ